MEIILAILLGFSLSAAAGFRVFVPFLVISIAAKAGFVELANGFSWIGSDFALGIFLIATILEIGAYYIPVVDNFLDMIALPAALVAGTILTATVITDMSPVLRWTLAIVAGGGTAVTVHATTAAVRGASTVVTAGLGNGVVSSLENTFSLIISIFALISPFIAIVALVVIVLLIFKLRKNNKQKIEGS